ncbi:MAG: hypothetical protein EOP84_08660 [Verrucomicrobiaceae bacterium]|nr:MAG: hypothetical protein EOP84_08660 [Verrucomicrobiaceae bacterium]
MESQQLAEFLRSGVIQPLRFGLSRESTEAILGAPDDWTGRIAGIGWEEPTIDLYREALHWHYGSLCVSFDESGLLTSLSITYGYTEIFGRIRFPSLFAGLPSECFSVGELCEFLRRHAIAYDSSYSEFSDVALITEGEIAAGTSGANNLPESAVTSLFHCSPSELRKPPTPRFFRSGRYYGVAYSDTQTRTSLFLTFSPVEVPVPEIVTLSSMENERWGSLEPEQVRSIILEAAAAANASQGSKFYPAKIGFCPDDTPRHSLLGYCATLIIERLASGRPFDSDPE